MADVVIGTDSPDYTLVAADLGADIYCKVTATNAAGSASADSNTVGPVAAAAAGLSPATTNMWTWLKADAGTFQTGSTPATAEAAPVGNWEDQSGGGKHFTQSTSGQRPTLHLGVLNSKPVLRFVLANGRFLDGPTMAALTAGEVFIVVKAVFDPSSGVGTGESLWTMGSSTEDILYPYLDGDVYDTWGTTVRKGTGNPTPALDAWRLYNVVSTSSEWTSFFDGVQYFTTATNTVGFTATPGLARNYASNATLSGDIAEVIIYSAKCSAPDKAQTVAYLSDKYALGF